MNIFEERGTRHKQNDVFLRKFLLLLATLTTITPKQEMILIQQHQQHFLVNNLRGNQHPAALNEKFKIVYTSPKKKYQSFVIFSFSHLSNGCGRYGVAENDLLKTINFVLWNFIKLT